MSNEKLIIGATNFIRKIFNIDESLWVFISDITHFDSLNHIALYDKENFLIRYNIEWLKIADEENIIKTAFHEVYHVIQHDAIIKWEYGFNEGIFTDGELEIITSEFYGDNYVSDLKMWETLLIEKQANEFSVILYEKLVEIKIDLVIYLKSFF